uniref:Reverse transcriptase domain-containing protein n=1 Tax=Maylandia zebra TaxID=106582 RepID=A0A3P9C5G3_9CICH
MNLLGADNKILSKILALRLEKVMCSIVHADQTGFIKGRNSYNNTRRLFNIIHFLNFHQIPGVVVSMDAEKAFDRIEWEYMFEIMRRFGFGKNFLGWIKIIYKSPIASVLTNGLLSSPFSLSRGTAQGSPLSPLLFALAIEPLAMAIRQNPSVLGVKIGDRQHKILLYADDILLTLTDPVNSLPVLIRCIKDFGLISGYKVNFDKSVIMTLCSGGDNEPLYVKPFHWAPSGFVYLGVKVTPNVGHLYRENINGMVQDLREMLTRWRSLPISFLGRINLIKMVILPKILYPTGMLFAILKSEDIKVINKAMVDFIWAGRKPKIKLETLQLPKDLGGWGVPNIENYVLSIQARILSSWIHEHSDLPWLNIEEVLWKRLNDLPHVIKHNPLIYNAMWTWGKLRKNFNSSLPFNILSTFINNPDLLPQNIGSSFVGWHKVGVKRFYDLFKHGEFKSFESLKSQYSMSKTEFYKYLQLRNYVLKNAKTLRISTASFRLEKFFLDNREHKHFVSKFYSEIYALIEDKLAWLRKSWGTLLKCEIDIQAWDKILLLPSKISVCNRFKELQYKILHNVYISPYIYSKYNMGISPNCLKCKVRVGTRFHCLWECAIIQSFWKEVCANISTAIGHQVTENPLMCILGYIPVSLVQHEYVIQSLLMLARKSIMLRWVGAEPPSISLWKSLIIEVMTLIRLGHYIDGSSRIFVYKWKRPLEALGVTYKLDPRGQQTEHSSSSSSSYAAQTQWNSSSLCVCAIVVQSIYSYLIILLRHCTLRRIYKMNFELLLLTW